MHASKKEPDVPTSSIMYKLALFFLTLLCLGVAVPSYADRVATKYGDIEYQTQEDLLAFGRGIRHSISPAFKHLPPPAHVIVDRIEFIVEQVSRELDIKCNNLKFSIKITPTDQKLNDAYKKINPKGTDRVRAFYEHKPKKVWLSAEHITRELVIHEITHVLIDHYFIRPIPKGVDELIAEAIEKIPL